MKDNTDLSNSNKQLLMSNSDLLTRVDRLQQGNLSLRNELDESKRMEKKAH